MENEKDNQLRHPRRGVAARWRPAALTVLLLGGTLALLVILFRDELIPPVSVDVHRAILLEHASDDVTEGAIPSEQLFQASGWLEPDPWAVQVPALADGFVTEVFVREGESVTNGQLLARMDAADATLELGEADAEVRAAEAYLKSANDRWDRLKDVGLGSVALTDLVTAETLTAAMSGRLVVAQARRDMAALTLSRMEIRSPMDGVVMRRYVGPGSKRGRLLDDENSAVIVSLFDPQQLQVRVDVPLAEAGGLEVGQPTRIATALLPGRVFTGTVTRIVGQADLQRNTLQAKVAVHDPDPRMRPDVLCRVEFWTLPATRAGSVGRRSAAGRQSLWLAEEALGPPDEQEQEVWVVDPVTMTVARRGVRLGRRVRDGLRHIPEGLRVNEMVVAGGTMGSAELREGQRIKLRIGEE